MKTIAITAGDSNGIGPEVALGAALSRNAPAANKEYLSPSFYSIPNVPNILNHDLEYCDHQ